MGGGDIAIGRVCSRCVMDTTDPDISFDNEGFCNHCRAYDVVEAVHLKGAKALDAVIRALPRLRDYDCLIGLSGGVDSSLATLIAYQKGLRVLLTHFDNGYNDPRATSNIQKIVDATGFDMKPFSMNLDEFHDMQTAFLKAGVIDIEMVTDHAITASIFHIASKMKIKTILSGGNLTTETIMPKAWGWTKGDVANIKDIHRKYGKVKMKTFPTMEVLKRIWYIYFQGIKTVKPLDFMQYNREEAKQALSEWVDWKDYGLKHYESIFTRFYQAYILPTKFNVDKRKAHFSTMICSNQMTRQQALTELEKPLYTAKQLEKDRQFVLEQLGMSDVEFDMLMKRAPVPHSFYASDDWIYNILRRLHR